MIKPYLASSRLPASASLAEAMQSGDVVWIDVLNATSDELAEVEKATGLVVPSLVSLSEIEHSSRMRREGEAIVLSLPLARPGAQGMRLLPVGFMLTKGLLLTVRFDAEAIFDDFVKGFAKGRPADTSAPSIMAGIFEAIVDAMADRLEEVGTKLDVMAGQVLGRDGHTTSLRSTRAPDLPLRQLLREIGTTGQMLGKLRATLLTGGRIVHYVEAEGATWFKDGIAARMSTIKADIASLDEYETHLSDKVQFLLDATLGLINMQQNDLFKVLTIVSVIGIPPTLVASIYGMNFHDMPELSWAYGYPYGLAVIALSAAIPLIWFKIKGWF
jgi:magnesium transporter